MQTIKFHGSYEELLETVIGQVLDHQGHFCVFSLTDLDFAEIRCTSCRSSVIQGSRELIELIWTEFNNLGSSSPNRD